MAELERQLEVLVQTRLEGCAVGRVIEVFWHADGVWQHVDADPQFPEFRGGFIHPARNIPSMQGKSEGQTADTAADDEYFSVGHLLPFKPRYNAFAGRRRVRHIWAAGELSLPSPSSGCLKWRPMISSKSSTCTSTSGSNAYRSFRQIIRADMYHL